MVDKASSLAASKVGANFNRLMSGKQTKVLQNEENTSAVTLLKIETSSNPLVSKNQASRASQNSGEGQIDSGPSSHPPSQVAVRAMAPDTSRSNDIGASSVAGRSNEASNLSKEIGQKEIQRVNKAVESDTGNNVDQYA